jgi:isopenicillin-N N-acyltransferase-like protein
VGLGRAHGATIARTVALYERLFEETLAIGRDEVRRFGAQVSDVLQREAPELGEEILGVASGARLDEQILFAVNARSELLGASLPSECSVIWLSAQRSRTGRPLLAQNWDWHPAWAPVRLLWTIRQPDGHWWATLTEAGILGKIGVNSWGIACALNRLGTAGDGGSGGLPVHALLRRILEHADTVPRGVALVEAAALSSSACITIGGPGSDGDPSIVSVEASPEGAVSRSLDFDGWVVHTNHFLWSSPQAGDVAPKLWHDSYDRLRCLEQALERRRDPLGRKDLQALLSSHDAAPSSVCRHDLDRPVWSEQTQTLLSMVIDLATGTLWVSDGPPCSNPYRREMLPPGNVPATPAGRGQRRDADVARR